MKNLLHYFCLLVLLFSGILYADAQTYSLGTVHNNYPKNYFGLNGASLINDDTWQDLDAQNVFNNESFSILRYPGGTVANYWGWQLGFLYSQKNMPSGITLPQKFTVDNLGKDRMEDFKLSVDKLASETIFDFNIMTSNLHDQLGMIYNARSLSLPVTSIELGNEFYLDQKNYITKFSSAAQYATVASGWATAIKNLGNNYAPKIAAVGAWSKNGDSGRQRMWLDNLLKELPINCDINAVTIHQYIGDKLPANLCNASYNGIQDMMGAAFDNMDALESNELSRISSDTKNPYLEVWITEFNMAGAQHDAPGSWAHGLFDASRLLAYQHSDRVKKVLMHDIVEGNVSSPIYFNGAANPFGIISPTCSSAIPPAVTPWEHTASGSAYSMIAAAARGANTATEINIAGVGNLHATNHPEVYGWLYTKSYDTEIVILNLCSLATYSITPSTLLSGSGYVDIETISGDPKTYVKGDAVAVPGANQLLKFTGTQLASSNYTLPPWSITRIVKRNGYALTPTVSQLCTHSTTTVKLEGSASGSNYTWTTTCPTNVSVIMPNGAVSTFTAPVTIGSPLFDLYTIECRENGNLLATSTLKVYQGFTVSATPGAATCTGATLTGSITGTTSGTVNYKWIPSGGLTHPTSLITDAFPDSTSEYALYVSDNYCAAKSTPVKVNVLDTPHLGADLKVCIGTDAKIRVVNYLNYSAAATYQWTGGNAATNAYDRQTGVLATGTSTYTVLVTEPGGCSKSNTIIVNALQCCSIVNELTINPPAVNSALTAANIEDNYVTSLTGNTNNDGFVKQLTNISAYNTCWNNATNTYDPDLAPLTCPSAIYINGKLRLNNSITFINCDIFFGEGAELFTEANGNSLRTITFSGCRLAAASCSATPFMWDKINFNDENFRLVITEKPTAGGNPAIPTSIADAETAVNLENSANFLIEKSNFNRNRTHLKIAYTTASSDVKFNNSNIAMRENIIMGNAFNCTSALNITTPSSYTQNAIELNHVVDIQIGDNHTVFYPLNNTFSNCDIGISAENSSLVAINNDFNNLLAPNGYSGYPVGSGIYANSSYDCNDRTITIGKSPDDANTFQNSIYGVTTRGEINSFIKYNTFDVNISRFSVQTYLNSDKTCTVSENLFNGFNTGVYIGGLGDAAHLTIDHNTFNTGQFVIKDNFSAAAIVALASAGGRAKNAVIAYNEITDPRIGIYAINLPAALIRFNTVTYATDAANTDNYGIEVVGSNQASVLDNTVSYTPATAPSNKINGISIESSQYALVSRNKTYETGTGMYFYGNCSNTELRCNEFHKDITGLMDIGVQLQDAGASSVTLTQQGNIDDPWQNQWYGSFSPYRVGGSGAQFIWYWDQNNQTVYDPIPDPNIVNSIQTGLNGVDPCGMPDSPPGDVRNERMTAVVNDTVIYNGAYSNENRYKDMQAVYGLMKINDSLITQGNADDVGYELFFTNMQQSNIEQLQAVDSLITFDDDTNALIINTNIVDTNLHETNSKLYNEIYLRTIAIGQPLTANDSLELYNIATQRITEGGDAVALSRAALFLEIHETPPFAARIGKTSNEEATLNEAILYPNPTKDYIVLNTSIKEGEKLLVCDALGVVKFVLKFYKDESSTIINTRQLTPGSYLLKFASRPKQDALTFTVIR